MTDQGTFYSGADPSFPSDGQVTDWAEHNAHADGLQPDEDREEPQDLALNTGASFLPQTGDDGTRPAVTIAGAMVFAYVRDGALRVSVDLDEPDDYLVDDDGLVRLEITVQGEPVFAYPADEPAGLSLATGTVSVARTWDFTVTSEPGTWPDMPTHAGARDVIRPDTLVVKVSAADGAAPEIAEWVAAGASLYPDGRVSPHRDRSCDYYTHESVPDWVTASLAECLALAQPG